MAKDPAPTPGETADDPVADAPDGAERTGRSLGSWLVLAALILLPAVGGSWLAYNQYGWLDRTASSFQGDDAAQADGDAPIEYGTFTELENLIVNPAGSHGERYLAVSLGFEAEDAAVLAELEEREVVVRDALLSLLSARTVDELSTVAQRDSMKGELREAVNARLPSGGIDRIYFTRYVLQ